ncbi:cytosolic carboxypeptidase 6 isoform X2 [Anopheles arabiensis]|uniref:AGAP001814-PA n=1 Tax=Anopheles gambiae TaxID=7165 RepID=A7UVJ6_ANOGA|nr:cytosolic carboxypeptidase 6 isoform X1 [Anopheles gambiae]XP_040154343.1 cytosolic carboxypeptidase 6 isoform X2 [Anopheles arabiensis]EDO63226.2 AGAP001814-PA [Anopheles gambiae str. PEST]
MNPDACDPLAHTSMYQRAEEDSDDSDGEGGLGNVSRVIVRPPGHSGKAKRGHLCFDAAFETGNLGRVDLVGEFEYDLFLRPDTCNPRYRFWFNFTVDNVKQDQRVIFNIVNMNKSRNLFKDGMTPLVKSTSRPKWQRLPRCEVFYYKSPVHQNHYVLSFAFGFDKEDEVYQFALTFPYSYSKMQAYLNAVELKFPEAFERSSLGMSIQNRKLELITFDDVKKPDKMDPKNVIHMVVILARIHPGESPASYVVQGLIEFLAAANQPISKALREHVVFKIVPMLNPDGVFLGNNRCNVIGHDLNRSWNRLSQYTHPTLSAVMKMLKEYDNSSCYQVDFVIDLHAHSSLTGTFIYGSTYDNVYRYERHLVFPKLFATKCEDFCQEHMMFNADDRKSGTARRYFVEALSDNVNTYTLEVSMCGYFLNGTNILTQYTEDGYMRIGRNLARTFLEYYRFTNILPIPPVDELRPRKGRPRTHRPRARSKTRSEVRVRPKTTRAYAPISYTDLSICYDSATSEDGSPVRYMYGHPGHGGGGGGLRMRPHIHQDQFSLSNIQAARFSNLDFSSDFRLKVGSRGKGQAGSTAAESKMPPIEMLSVPPKPHLTIIDFNQLTRGGLEEATAGKTLEREKEKIRRHTVKSSSRKA